MTSEFLKTHKVALTPLSPLHIGCGEDFEPTNYVIDVEEKLLYGFDPCRAVLPDDLSRELGRLGESGNWLRVQAFFREHQAYFKPLAHVLMSVAGGVARDYQKKVGKAANIESDGKQVINQLSIERHTHSRNTPYVPGSSLKGALRTALMDRINGKHPVTDQNEKKDSSKLARRLLGGDYMTSPSRLLKIGDLMPKDQYLAREVLYAVNRYKRPQIDQHTQQQKSPRGIVARKECIQAGQYRALTGEIVLQNLLGMGIASGEKANVPNPNKVPSLMQIAKDSNAYHLPRLRNELVEMDKTGLVNPVWKKDMDALLKKDGSLDNLLKEGRALLVRLGRYGGAESKTLTEVANIKIMGKRVEGKPQFDFRNKTTTYWLAAQTAEDQKHLIPFGWAILEIDPQEDLVELRTWCEKTARNHPDLHEKYVALEQAKSAAESAAARQRAEREVQQEKERQAAEIEVKAKAEREKQLAAMSEAGRKIEAYKEACAKHEQSLGGRKGKPYGADYQQAKTLADTARTGADWNADDKKAAAEAIEYWLPRLETLEAKEVRKKLKLTELKGSSA